MGMEYPRFIIVMSFEQEIKVLHESAILLFKDLVSNVVKSNVNGYYTFMISWCGSKDGWQEDCQFKRNINQYKRFLEEFREENYIEYRDIKFKDIDF